MKSTLTVGWIQKQDQLKLIPSHLVWKFEVAAAARKDAKHGGVRSEGSLSSGLDPSTPWSKSPQSSKSSELDYLRDAEAHRSDVQAAVDI